MKVFQMTLESEPIFNNYVSPSNKPLKTVKNIKMATKGKKVFFLNHFKSFGTILLE